VGYLTLSVVRLYTAARFDDSPTGEVLEVVVAQTRYYPGISIQHEENREKNFRISGFHSAENLPNTSLGHYRYANHLSNSASKNGSSHNRLERYYNSKRNQLAGIKH
jgi:hypothetical protein